MCLNLNCIFQIQNTGFNSIIENYYFYLGLCCVMKEEKIETIKKEPLLECTHTQVDKISIQVFNRLVLISKINLLFYIAWR